MVSLINFKTFNEELQQRTNQSLSPQQQPLATSIKVDLSQPANRTTNYAIRSNEEADVYERTPTTTTFCCNASQQECTNHKTCSQQEPDRFKQMHRQAAANGRLSHSLSLNLSQPLKRPVTGSDRDEDEDEDSFGCHRTRCPSAGDQFTVTWRNLTFAIEPKWHAKLSDDSPFSRLVNRLRPGRGAAGHHASDDQQVVAVHQTTTTSSSSARIVLDKLDGSFRSGELTAILGPSGAGKTTLLDCLTGHRKHGLSGSIRISSSPSSAANGCNSNNNSNNGNKLVTSNGEVACLHKTPLTTTTTQNAAQQKINNNNQNYHQQMPHCNHKRQHDRQPDCSCGCGCYCCGTGAKMIPGAGSPPSMQVPPVAANADNLKVSIIPQNDHLMGHLTVYETLNYASKMKNCFDKQFNHKVNVRRVAQQLGLMTCLATRINKLSGGQYKRVSIAQELLSSPDILILDEPTSGLDAMTCYQTVQVLKRLTESSNGLKQIAVILTIHQPNSDVFQQFNNVYVVAHGGKCIYEGPPSHIESVINRVGIHLPNSYYNPATMIVEIAAGKFGQEAMQELNCIQKRQYELRQANCLDVEQNSNTGDSAVDCPSSSNDSNYDDNDNNNNNHDNSNNNDHDDDDDGEDNADDDHKDCPQEDNNNNNTEVNNNNCRGLTNRGFVTEEEIDVIKKANSTVVVSMEKEASLMAMKGASHLSGHHHLFNDHQLAAETCKSDSRRKRRRRIRRRTGSEQPANNNNNCTSLIIASKGSSDLKVASSGGGGGGGGGGDGSPNGREKRIKLNSLKADQRFPFWRHTYLHFHRSWLSIVRDPMLCSMQLALHIIVPVMVSLVYGTNVGKPNACPRAGPVDIMAYALEPQDAALQLQEDLRTTLENIGYIFFKLYGIIFAAMTVTVLTFPLDMHVLVKEFRNGWYGLSSYFLGRTLADIPFQLTLPLLAMSLSYYATGQPYSYMQWRFLSITGILILSSLIAQSQGLLFGAILMDRMKAAVFVAPAATTPIILFAGFLVRTQSIPHYLRPLSNLSYLRYAIEACLISRYGFNQCECDPAIFNQTVPELPPIARSMLDYWLSSFKTSANEHIIEASSNASATAIIETTTTTATAQADQPDLFTKLIDSLAKANSFGRNITSCEQVVPYPMMDYDLKDSQLAGCFGILLMMLIFTRLLTFFIVCFKVKRKV